MSTACTVSRTPFPSVVSIPPSKNLQYIASVSPPTMSDLFREFASPSPQSLPPSPAPSQMKHRVSKARKGKRVHACEFPGCAKVFTRAEHRRRHELSHKPMKLYTCSYEGCTKGFHRSDCLSQHMAQHDTEYLSKRSPSLRRTNPASSPVPPTQQEEPFHKSPMLPGFQSPPPSISTATSSSPAQSMTCTSPPCYDCQNHAQNDVTCNSVYNYPLDMGQTPISQIGFGIGPDTTLDQYLRSVLRPEAFLVPPQPQAQMDSSFWANLDPNLPLVNSSTFQNSTINSSWTSAPDSLSTTVTAHGLSCTSPSQPQ